MALDALAPDFAPAPEARVSIDDRMLRELIALARSAQRDRITPAEAELVLAALPPLLEELAHHRARRAADDAAPTAVGVVAARMPRLINDSERRGAIVACDTLEYWGRQIERNGDALGGDRIMQHTGRFLAGSAQTLRRHLSQPA